MAKNIILFMADQLRSDSTGYADGGNSNTPNIDRIAGFANFRCCNTTNPICVPARTSLITGRYPRQIGTLTMSGDLFPQIPTFMQALQRQGYRTYGIGKFHFLQTYPCWNTKRGCGMDPVAMEEETRKFGFDYIWETAGKQMMNTSYCFYARYLDARGMLDAVRDFEMECGGINGDTADHNYDKALPWPFDPEDYVDVVTGRMAREQIQQHDPDVPMYMCVSFCGPHKPYDAPQKYIDRIPYEEKDNFIPDDGHVLNRKEKEILYKQRRSSKAMMQLIDEQIGLILECLKEKGMAEDTMLLFVSDHGDMLGDHGLIQKGVPWRQAAEVPLAISLPGFSPVGSCSCPVELSDLAATILDYAGVDVQRGLSREWPAYNDRIPSRSILPVLKGECGKVREYCFCESDFTEEIHEGSIKAEILKKRGGGGRRSDNWQAVISEKYKYIKYLGYDKPGEYYEEFYDLRSDPAERRNVIECSEYGAAVKECRDYLTFILDHYPPAQKTWCTACAADRSFK